MVSDETMSNIERWVDIGEKIAKLAPSLIELLGVGYLAGNAAENIGGDFAGGALGGMVADRLLHTNLPHNQIGGAALGTYFAALGLLNLKGEGLDLSALTPEGMPQGFEWILDHLVPVTPRRDFRS